MVIYEDFGRKLAPKPLYDAIKQSGFDGVSLYWRESFDCGRTAPPLLAREAGLYVDNIHMPFDIDANDLWRDNAGGAAITECFFRWVEDCARFEIPSLVVHLIHWQDTPPFGELGLNRVRRVVELAEKLNVNIAFENLHSTDALAYVLGHIDSPKAGFCYDSGHHNCLTPTEDLLPRYGSRLMVLHLHDNQGRITGAPTEDQHLLPFDGTINWPELMEDIAKTGYTGPVSLEVMNRGYESLAAEEFLRLAYERSGRLCLR